MSNVYVGSVLTRFVITVKNEAGVIQTDLTADQVTLRFKSPTGTVLNRAVTATEDEGVFEYYTTAEDLTRAGTWKMEVIVDNGVGLWPSDIQSLPVKETL